ncbi:hypothetical protein ACFOLJ_08260 [Rugamonas sp. CCM 8940]|uniref:hypothetical protein n=1 Tax=Rugamonas sp. CCM 8940 TaxID=2765359 RepID=UPI0018F2D378|nr:hypothetical protein [Rugamonas sp. CCM 8940]MBJ7309932.1 hypothetical protein [Rugamonas sp. CCM 8940]
MPSTTTPSATARAPSPITNLLAELRHANTIIKAMLNAMTLQQKAKVHEKLDAAGVSGEGMTRHHERAAVIEAAATALAEQASRAPVSASKPSARPHLLEIEALASDIDGQGEHVEILLVALLAKLDELRQPDGEAAVAAINCFATCAIRNAVLMREASDLVLEHVEAGMAA